MIGALCFGLLTANRSVLMALPLIAVGLSVALRARRDGVREAVLSHTAVVVAAIAGWGAWAFVAQRAGFSHFEWFMNRGDLPYPSALGSFSYPVAVLLWVVFGFVAGLNARRAVVRWVCVVGMLALAVLLGVMSLAVASWDIGAYWTLVLTAVCGCFVAVRAGRGRSFSRGAAVMLSVLLVAATQAAAPRVPAETLEARGDVSVTALQQGCVESVESGEASLYLEGETRLMDPMGWMIPVSFCSRPVTELLADTAPDGCHSPSTAYRYLAVFQGRYAGDLEFQVRMANRMLTAAWLRGRDEMRSGFCVSTADGVRTFTLPGGDVLFTSARDSDKLDFAAQEALESD